MVAYGQSDADGDTRPKRTCMKHRTLALILFLSFVAGVLLVPNAALIRDWFDDQEFMPHGACVLWRPEVLWPRVAFHGAIALAYFVISGSMSFYLRSKPDVSFSWIGWGFVSFIAACGVTHAFAILVNWIPAYRPENIVLGVTAALSCGTAYYVWRYLPTFMEMPTVKALQRQVQSQDADMQRLKDVLAELRAGKGA